MAEEEADWMGIALQTPECVWLAIQILAPVV